MPTTDVSELNVIAIILSVQYAHDRSRVAR